MHLHRTLLLVAFLLFGLLTPFPFMPPTVHAAPDNTCFSAWTPVPMPKPAGEAVNLRRVASSGPDDVWAVGHFWPNGLYYPPLQTLTEHWDGNEWTIVPSPNVDGQSNRLTDVAVLSKADAWAVGWSMEQYVSHPLLQHWDGTAWMIVDPLEPKASQGELVSVSGTAPHDVWAVGSTWAGALILHFDGTAWKSVPSPTNLSFRRVIAKAADDVWALGEDADHKATVLHWDRSVWSIVTSFQLEHDDVHSPNAHIESISDFVVLAANGIWVVGTYQEKYSGVGLRWFWNGTSWTDPEHSANGVSSNGIMPFIAGVEPDNLWIGGGEQDVIHDVDFSRRDSTGWTYHDMTYLTRAVEPGAITAVSADEFWVVGFSYTEPQALHGIFTCTTPPSGPLTLLSPTEGEITTDLRPTFSWQGSPDTAYYNLQVSASQPGAYYTFDHLMGSAFTIPSYWPLTNGAHSWRVQSCNYVGCDEWSDPINWIVGVPLPETPQLLSPPTGTSIPSDSVTTTWTAVTNTDEYIGELYMDTPTGPLLRNFDSRENLAKLSALSEASYSWHIKACGPGGCSGWSDMFEFDIFHPAPNRPNLLIPKASATVKTRRPWLGWESSGAGLYYRLQLRKDSRGGSIIDTRTVHYDPNYHWQGPLSNGTYYWRVKACNEFRCSKWTKGRKFFVNR